MLAPPKIDAPLGVPCELGELARRRRLHELPREAAREADSLSVDLEHRRRAGAASASGASRNSIPTRSRIVSAFSSRSARPSSETTSTRRERPRQERHAFHDGVQARRLPCCSASCATAHGLTSP